MFLLYPSPKYLRSSRELPVRGSQRVLTRRCHLIHLLSCNVCKRHDRHLQITVSICHETLCNSHFFHMIWLRDRSHRMDGLALQVTDIASS